MLCRGLMCYMRIGVLTNAGLFLFASLAFAHHSFEAEYDSKKPVTLKGTLTKIEWENPHVQFYVDVADSEGNVEHWTFELFPPNVLTRLGWNKDETVKPGEVITVFGWRARDGATSGHAREITLPDGRKMTAGSASGLGAYFVPSAPQTR